MVFCGGVSFLQAWQFNVSQERFPNLFLRSIKLNWSLLIWLVYLFSCFNTVQYYLFVLNKTSSIRKHLTLETRRRATNKLKIKTMIKSILFCFLCIGCTFSNKFRKWTLILTHQGRQLFRIRKFVGRKSTATRHFVFSRLPEVNKLKWNAQEIFRWFEVFDREFS